MHSVSKIQNKKEGGGEQRGLREGGLVGGWVGGAAFRNRR